MKSLIYGKEKAIGIAYGLEGLTLAFRLSRV